MTNKSIYEIIHKKFLFFNLIAAAELVTTVYTLTMLIASLLIYFSAYFPDIPIICYNYFEIIVSSAVVLYTLFLLKLPFISFNNYLKILEKSAGSEFIFRSAETALQLENKNIFSLSIVDEAIIFLKKQKIEFYLHSAAGRVNRLILILTIIAAPLHLYIFNFKFNNLLNFFNAYYSSHAYLSNINAFKVEPGSINILKGADIAITVKIYGSNKYIPNLHILKSSGSEEIIPFIKTASCNKIILKNIIDDFSYFISTPLSVSNKFFVKTYINPYLQIEYIKITPPEYTERESEFFYSYINEINAINGSNIELKINLNFKSTQALLDYAGRQINSSENEGNIYKFIFKTFSTGKLDFNLTPADTSLITNFNGIFIKIKKDDSPKVDFEQPDKKETLLADDMLTFFTVAAIDDFGISSGKIFTSSESFFDSYPLDFRKISDKFTAYYTIDFSKKNLLPGDEITYYAEVFDNDAVSGFKRAYTDKRKITMPSATDIFKELNNEIDKSMNAMDMLKKKNAGIVNSTKKIINDLIRSNSNDWTTQKQIKELIERQQQIQDELKKIQESIDKAVENYKKTKELLGAETLEKIQKLNKLMSEAMTDDIKKSLSLFQNALQSRDAKQSGELLKKAVFDKDEFNKRIDRTLSLLSQLKTQSALKNIQKNINELAAKQRDINEKLNNGDLKSAEEMQSKSNSELQKMDELLKNLNAETTDKDTQKMIDKIEKAIEALKKNAEKLSSDISETKRGSEKSGGSQPQETKKKTEKLKKESENLQKQLSDLADRLNSMMSQMANKEFEKHTQELDVIIFKMIGLQEKINNFKNFIQKAGDALNNPYSENILIDYDDNINLLQEYQNFLFIQSTRYFYLTTKSFVFPPELVEDFKQLSDLFGIIKDNFTLKNLEITPITIKRISSSNADLTYKLIKIKSEMEKQNSSQNSSGMSERLEQLAKAQQSLNSMSFNMDNFSQEQLDQMAQEQSLIRSGLEQMMEGGRGGDSLNQRLQKLVDEMNRIEKQLKKGEYNQQVKDDQKSLYNKLMDNAKALKKEEPDQEKRESKTAVDLQKLKRRQSNDNAAVQIPEELQNYFKHNLPPEYKNEINDYYNMLLNIYLKNSIVK